MRRLLGRVFMLLVLLAMFTSCLDDKDNAYDEQVDEVVNVSQRDTYEYNLGSFGDKEEASITVQARHFAISEMQQNQETGDIIYRYQPHDGFTGSDFVKIKTSRSPDGTNSDSAIGVIRIKFKVAE